MIDKRMTHADVPKLAASPRRNDLVARGVRHISGQPRIADDGFLAADCLARHERVVGSAQPLLHLRLVDPRQDTTVKSQLVVGGGWLGSGPSEL
jgi:hypothetical protein